MTLFFFKDARHRKTRITVYIFGWIYLGRKKIGRIEIGENKQFHTFGWYKILWSSKKEKIL